MSIIELTSLYTEPFINFAKVYEYKSISFISRVYQNKNLIIPPSKIAKVFCEVSDSNPNIIKNALMITSGGILMPIFSDKQPSHIVIFKLIKKVLHYKNKIYCILGIKKDTEYLKKYLNYSLYSTIDYSLLTENFNKKYYMDKTPLKVKKANKRDTLILFSLEKAYLLEEVLGENSEINHQAAFLNLKKTCTYQSVFYGLIDKKIIAKVNTNGQGFSYNQIGGVYTKPEYRNQGISTYLMKILINEIHSLGKNAVLYVKKGNKPALTLYKNLGFHIISDYSAHYIIK